MVGFTDAAKSLALDGITVNAIRLHSGDPGAAGTNNALGSGTSAATFNAAASNERQLNADVTVTGLTANQSVTHFSIWQGATFRGGFAISSGDTQANAAGEYVLKQTTTKITATG